MPNDFNGFMASLMATNCSKIHKNDYIQCCNYHSDYDVARGEPFKQLWHEYPWVKPYYFDFEACYDADIICDEMKANNLMIPIISIVAYLLFIYFGIKVMENYKPWRLDKVLAAWNLTLCLLSLYMTVRLVPHSVWLLTSKTIEESFCDAAYLTVGGGAAGLALQLFILSKIPELLDTVFIILRKKPLIFLHWYHHVTVLLLCWYAYVTEASNGYIFATMNSFVHTIMYFYFFMQTIKYVPRSFPTWIITVIQILQMVLGTIVTISSIYYYLYGGSKYAPGECGNHPIYLIMGAIIYMSYLYLFVKFAILRFVYGATVDQLKKQL